MIYIAVFPLESFLLPRPRSGHVLSPTRTPDPSHHWST
jgi:hypothetical protein